MAAGKKITQVNITTTGQYSGNLDFYCPYASGTTGMNNWFEHLLSELFSRRGGDIKMPINTAGTDFIFIDKDLITSVTVTLS